VTDGTHLIDALAHLPGGPQLLAACEQREDDVSLVGGAVRDLLLARTPRELDVVVAHDAGGLARQLADVLGARVTVHERFGTALVEWEEGRVDIAARRAESYAAPGALPDVRAGSVEEDLARRDFTVNAIALTLTGASRGAVHGAEHALADLHATVLRVLHDRSFLDDPTRLWRLARYSARLDFQPEPHTAGLAAAAVAARALATVSPARVGAELRLALGELDAPSALERIDALALLAALHPRLRFDGDLARASLDLLALAETAGRRPPRQELLMLAVLLTSIAAPTDGPRDGVPLQEREGELYELLGELEFPAADRDLASYEAISMRDAAERLAGARTPSQVYRAASHMAPEGVALAGAWGALHGGYARAAQAAREWLTALHHVTLQITGDDLLAAGVPQGPEIRRRLDAALLRKLDGALAGDGRDAELDAALGASP
jgi:tRNA nucleotidyltransferase (CCA-adding enzyme)